MKHHRLWAVIAVPLFVFPPGPAARRTVSNAASLQQALSFKATFAGTIRVNQVDLLATRNATGTLASLGKARLVAHDSQIYLPDNNITVGQVTAAGSGTFSFGKKGSLLFLYVIAGDRVVDGYFIIYGGTGKYLHARGGRGTLHEVEPSNRGGTAPITDTFAGSLTIAG